jgi:cation transport regulator
MYDLNIKSYKNRKYGQQFSISFLCNNSRGSMPRRVKKSISTKGTLSTRTKKQIDSLPEHAQEIYKEAHANALKQYQKAEKRRGGKKQSAEQVAHKVAWASVKKKYEKQRDMWVEK